MKRILLLISIVILFVSCMGKKVDRSPVKNVILTRYMGTWYEIARFDHRFERGVSYSMAEYTLDKDGTVQVVNSGIKNRKMKTSDGKAYATGTPGLLRVSFFEPFYSDYRILMIDDDYDIALVGSGRRGYLWLMSRSPYMCNADAELLLQEAERRGYDTDRLIWVEQDVPIDY